MSRTIAIGDIHGCAAALRALLDAIDLQPDDVLITLGDYIDRGPDSRGVLEQLIALDDRCQLVPLLGNHELMLLEARENDDGYRFWTTYGGWETLESYGGRLEDIPVLHLAFIHGCRRFYESDTHLFVHANYDARLPLARQPDRLLFWEHVVHTRPERHVSGKTAIVGHTPQASGEILDLGHLLCIDTYCVGNGWLTALEVTTGQVWQADRFGQLRNGD